ncbi:MAG: glycosyltransferase family 4 protein [Polyangiaceae bacterium]|nr:glycosyltransferase family 4 protein [Polyangiaceae bacterium]
MKPRVLFVSKPIVPPFHDGTKCLVRDLAQSMTEVRPAVMGELAGVDSLPVYSTPGRFTPSFTQNARAALYLFTRARAALWHFVFAPNPMTSQVGALARALRQVPVVQTVASPPLSFEGAERWLFGDVVVAQSRDTARQLLAAAVRSPDGSKRAPRVEVIPPCVTPPSRAREEVVQALRRQLKIASAAPIFLYPGDVETSSAALTIATATAELTRRLPGAVVVFACRAKTPAAGPLLDALRRRLEGLPVRFAGELPSILPLLQTSRAVLFPVDDLRGKVDLPIVLLEAMHLGVPVIAAEGGPLDDLEHTLRVPPKDAGALVAACAQLEESPERRQELICGATAAVSTRHLPAQVAARYEALYAELLAR